MRLHLRFLRSLGVAQGYPVVDETPAERLARAQSRRVPFLVLHALQLLLAIILLGLSAYNIHYVAYNVLVYCLVAEICTILVGLYLIVKRYKHPEASSNFVNPCLHLWMLVFWIVALGLLASLAEHWQQPRCTYSFASGYKCTSFANRGLQTHHKRDTTTYTAYSGALIAGAVFSSLEVTLWIITTSIVFLDAWQDHNSSPPPRSAATPQAEPAIPTVTQTLHRTPLSELWNASLPDSLVHRAGPEPILPDDFDESPRLLAPPPLRYFVTNQDHTPKSTPGFDVPPCRLDPVAPFLTPHTV